VGGLSALAAAANDSADATPPATADPAEAPANCVNAGVVPVEAPVAPDNDLEGSVHAEAPASAAPAAADTAPEAPATGPAEVAGHATISKVGDSIAEAPAIACAEESAAPVPAEVAADASAQGPESSEAAAGAADDEEGSSAALAIPVGDIDGPSMADTGLPAATAGDDPEVDADNKPVMVRHRPNIIYVHRQPSSLGETRKPSHFAAGSAIWTRRRRQSRSQPTLSSKIETCHPRSPPSCGSAVLCISAVGSCLCYL
jgi:hypothetical protein